MYEHEKQEVNSMYHVIRTSCLSQLAIFLSKGSQISRHVVHGVGNTFGSRLTSIQYMQIHAIYQMGH